MTRICTECGREFEGTGKPGRPFTRCASCRGMLTLVRDNVRMRVFPLRGGVACVTVRNGRGTWVQMKLTKQDTLPLAGALLRAVGVAKQKS